MDAIKKKMQAMKLEKDNALDRAVSNEQEAKDANLRAEKAEEEARQLQKKIQTIENDLDQTQEQLTQVMGKLEEKEKALQNTVGRPILQWPRFTGEIVGRAHGPRAPGRSTGPKGKKLSKKKA